MGEGPLHGLRVIDLTDDTGRFASKLLAECGASVARIGQAGSGPAMREKDAQHRGGLLDWWYDSGKLRLDVDLDTAPGRSSYRRLTEQADLIIETERPGRLADLGIDHPDLVTGNERLVQVSLTPFGRTGPRRLWRTSDLVASALGGVLSVSGLPDQPVNPWGRQALNLAGFVAAISGLAGVRAARVTGSGSHVDVSIHESVCTSIEQLFFQYWFDDVLPFPKIAPRQASLHWLRVYEVVPARDGWVMVTPAPNPASLLNWMVEEGFSEAVDLTNRPLEEVLGNVDAIMRTMASFARDRDATELFHEAQRRRIAFGAVDSVPRVADNPQHRHRGFFRAVDWPGTPVTLPGPVARFHGSPAPAPRSPGEVTDVEDLLTEWQDGISSPKGERTLGKPLEGVRVLDLSHVLAGPMCTRVLGDLGADVLKVQTTERATLVNDPGHPYFYVWNRSKRAVSLNMKDRRSIDVVKQLVQRSDVLIENFAAGVLDRWGLSYEQISAWNPGIIYLSMSMSGCGSEGPWSELVTYAPTIHALAGVTHLSNPPGRGDVGPGFSLNDHAAGLSGAYSVLAALIDRLATGNGQHIDIAQMETGSYLIGPALLDFLTNGREAQPIGNRDPFDQLVPNECYPTADGGWLAITCWCDEDWARVVDACGLAADPQMKTVGGRLERADEVDALLAEWAGTVTSEEGQELLQAAGVPAGKIQNAEDLMADPQLVDRALWHTFDHAVFGPRPHDRYPAVWSTGDLDPYLPSPAYVGEHNFEIYGELLGLDEVAIAERMGDGLFS
jgi:crotonobetainyl-CoA:carnitine CoA-transferase CaiB-like acyl-CoA transferase